VARIAVGATSSVTEAFDWRIRRRVAVKRLHPEMSGTLAVFRFSREALIASWLDHPNILPIYDMVFPRRGPPELIMKLVRGRTFAEEIAAAPPELSHMFQSLTALQKICDAVQFAHDAGVIHCDLKPQNVMVGARGEVFVTDWGISRFVAGTEVALTGVLRDSDFACNPQPLTGICGTPAYMAPEQALGDLSAVDERTDVFGLGGILYEILTGQQPYQGHQSDLVIAKAARRELVPPRKRTPERPIRPDLERLCMRAMSANKEERLSSAAEFSDELKSAMQGGSWFALRHYEAGAVIVVQGEPSDEAFLIERGACEVTQLQPSGETRVLRALTAGEVFGETGIFTGSPRSATVRAVTAVDVQCIDQDSLKWATNPGSPLELMVRSLAQRFLERERELS
jgi:serine/threonine-protein kinase